MNSHFDFYIMKYIALNFDINLFRFATRAGAENCKNMKDTLLDGKNVFIDWDAGFIPGRQYKRK